MDLAVSKGQMRHLNSQIHFLATFGKGCTMASRSFLQKGTLQISWGEVYSRGIIADILTIVFL